jgi:predicted transcriptional regulator
MSAVKDEVQTMINSLPNDCTMEDIQYHLYVIEKIQNGMDDIDNGKTISHEKAKEKMAKWL